MKVVHNHRKLVLGLVALPILATAQSSCSLAPSGSIKPSVASGFHMQVVATGLSAPRGIRLDGAGNLLVVEQSRGVISSHKINENNGCVSLENPKDLTANMNLNHGIEISNDGKTLYASSSTNAYSWAYDASNASVSDRKTLVANMTTDDHTTRTLLLSQKMPGMLIVTRGSTSNIDIEAASISSGHSQVKAFNLTNLTSTYDFDSDGLLLGWGLRNDVGIAEHPNSGGIYSVENSADQLSRDGVDVHEDNPAEEMNFFGYLNGSSPELTGRYFGYPWCFSAWKVSDLPNNGNLTVGSQYAIDPSSDSNNTNKTDAFCAAQAPARLVFQAHMAPLDIKFNNSGTEAWITFHGSWDRTNPTGYKMSMVKFNANGDPIDPSNSSTAAVDIFANQDNSVCPGNCLRPVGMAIDDQGRIYVSSDASGEIYLVSRDTSSSSGNSSSNSTSGSGTGSNLGNLIAPPTVLGHGFIFNLILLFATCLVPLMVSMA